ncbi:MAG: amidohydrolase [Ectothiorhodospiraceae bacterium]|nr:amidohydrolase [Chromatiales bacterium]MCP5154211.1 amidohydrolase [Ectothiorhodospiraceae bacterium]
MADDTAKRTAIEWVDSHAGALSDWHATIWDLHEPAWREYRSAAWYVERLRAEGFEVEAGSGGMPTAFCATWGDGGPTIGSYAEYDAVPGNSQDRVPYECPRPGVHRWAAGHTDPHSALGIAALGGVLAAKAAMERHGIRGRIKFMGEPAEKTCGSKPIHAAKGYYDDIDAAVSFHPSFGSLRANTTILDTHCGAYWSCIYTFECAHPETWSASRERSEMASAHTMARAPGANDALCLMYTTTKYTKEAMLPHTGTWTLNEAILGAGDATADNLAPRFAQIQYAWRAPTLAMQERIAEVLDRNAEHVAAMTCTRVRKAWVTRTRPGLPNHALAHLCYRNLAAVGAPVWDEAALAFCREIQGNLGLEPMAQPVLAAMRTLSTPEQCEANVRRELPEWQLNYTSDDYTDWTWHTPTVRLIVGRCTLEPPRPGYQYPAWAWNALGGHAPTIDPTVQVAAKTIGATIVDLLTEPSALAAARAEFEQRTGGGIGGTRWVAPLLPADFEPPIGFHWPEYVTTARGHEWYIPTTA